MNQEVTRKAVLYQLQLAIGAIELGHGLTKQCRTYLFLEQNVGKFPELAVLFNKKVKQKVKD